MKLAHHCLKDSTLFLLHTIGSNISKYHPHSWIHKYIFPNGILPSIRQIGKASKGLFIMEDWRNFGIYYDKTLMAWFKKKIMIMRFLSDVEILFRHAQAHLEYAIFSSQLLETIISYTARNILPRELVCK